ncbi:hypothetical protein EVAR_64542_1 [Eumeta japonica]|uniref:Uncharacterized protein n=1 Tax=Eumeta variegata TaxID=151549 RepID=A0A4C1ZPZ8_EUMVA|nr:hypothetical protein EVAR_64542_1 [Eumeta japonica]
MDSSVRFRNEASVNLVCFKSTNAYQNEASGVAFTFLFDGLFDFGYSSEIEEASMLNSMLPNSFPNISAASDRRSASVCCCFSTKTCLQTRCTYFLHIIPVQLVDHPSYNPDLIRNAETPSHQTDTSRAVIASRGQVIRRRIQRPRGAVKAAGRAGRARRPTIKLTAPRGINLIICLFHYPIKVQRRKTALIIRHGFFISAPGAVRA